MSGRIKYWEEEGWAVTRFPWIGWRPRAARRMDAAAF